MIVQQLICLNAAEKYVYCLVPFADDAQNARPSARQRAWENHEHFVCGYSDERLIELFPNPVFIRGTYWPEKGLAWRQKMKDMSLEDIDLEMQELKRLAEKDLVDPSAESFWRLWRNKDPFKD